MYRVLVVDDDLTCLKVAKVCLTRCNYTVTTVTNAFEALSLLSGQKEEKEISYDLVLTDVHMPDMNGFELLQQVNDNFYIPVILISADDKAEVISKGLRSGALTYLLKPIKTGDVKYLWQYSVLWKNRKKYAHGRFNEASVPKSICSSSRNTHTEEVSREKKTKELVWTAKLHNRFVEALLIIGPNNDVPRNILEVMNVPSLCREQVASHMQKFKKFLERVLDGETSLDSKYWIDCNYYSRTVGGNPNVILFNQLWEYRKTGKTATPLPASLPLMPIYESEASSGNMTVVPQQNLHTFQSVVNGELIGGTNNSMFPSTNNIIPSSGTTPIYNQSIYEQPFNMGSEGRNILFAENNYNNVVLRMENEQLNDPNIGSSSVANQFSVSLEMDRDQLGNVQPDSNFWNSFDAYQFENINQQVESVKFGNTANEFGNASAMTSVIPMSEQLGNVQLDSNFWNSFDAYQFENMNQQVESVMFGNTENEFGNASAMTLVMPMSEQLGSVQSDSNFWNSLDAYQFENMNQQVESVKFGSTANEFGNASAMTSVIPMSEQAPRFGGYVQMADGSWKINNNNQGRRLWR